MKSKRNKIAIAATWPDRAIVQRVVAQIPWRQNIALPSHQQFVQRLADQFNADERLWESLATLRRLRRKLHPRMKARKRKKLDLLDFAKAQPPKDRNGYSSDPWTESHVEHGYGRIVRREAQSAYAGCSTKYQTLSCRFYVSACAARICNLEVTNCDFKLGRITPGNSVRLH